MRSNTKPTKETRSFSQRNWVAVIMNIVFVCNSKIHQDNNSFYFQFESRFHWFLKLQKYILISRLSWQKVQWIEALNHCWHHITNQTFRRLRLSFKLLVTCCNAVRDKVCWLVTRTSVADPDLILIIKRTASQSGHPVTYSLIVWEVCFIVLI